MKSIVLTAAAIFTVWMANAQTTADTTVISLGDKTLLIIDPTPEEDTTDIETEEPDFTHWGGVDLGMNMLLNAKGTTTMDSAASWLDLDYSRSLSWRINLYEEKIKLYKDYIGILTGVGLTYNSYGLKNNVRIQTTDSTSTYAVAIPDSVMDFTKNKLRATYINVPLMLEFNTNDNADKNFHVAAGVIGGWKIGSVVKQKWDDGYDKHKYSHFADYNISPFTLDASARIGYKNFTVFAAYGLTPLFKKGHGPEVYPVTVGIQLTNF